MTTETANKTRESGRRRHYLDRSLQGWLLIGLILLEVALFSIALLILYQDLNMAVEARLYRAHAEPGGDMPVLLLVTLRLLGALVLVNVLAVLVADRLWDRRVKRVTGNLRQILKRVGALDFRGGCRPAADHPALAAACRWEATEAERCRRIRRLIDTLQTTDSGDVPLPEIEKRLRQIKELLPNA